MMEESSAKWVESHGQEYIDIVAKNYYEFGFLRGKKLKKQIKITDKLINAVIKGYNLSHERFLYYTKKYTIPNNYENEIQGLAEGSGLAYERILLQKSWIDIYYGILQPLKKVKENIGACTSFVLRTEKNQYIHGQTMDFSLAFLPTLNWTKYKILGKKPVFCLSLGCSNFPMGMNNAMTSTLNLIQTNEVGEFGIPTSIKSQIVFENCRDPSEFLKIMTRTYCGGWNYIYSDRKDNVFAVETKPVTNVLYYLGGKKYLVKTNTFQASQLKKALLDPLYSLERQQKAEELIMEKVLQKSGFEIEDGIDILCYNDGTEASICRFSDPNEYLKVCTEAYFLTNGKEGFYGIGNPVNGSWGQVYI